MKLLDSSVKIIPQPPGSEGMMKLIERAGRTAYKSEGRITESSYLNFVEMIKNRGHCFTGDTEILTPKGYIKFSEYDGEPVATVTEDGGFNGFEIPSQIIKKQYSGNFYEYPGLGVKVTDGHRMYGCFRSNLGFNKYEVFCCNTPFTDPNGRKKTLGQRPFSVKTSCNYTKPTLVPFYQLIGFWLGDGEMTKTFRNALRFRFKKARKKKYLLELCKLLGYQVKYVESQSRYYVYSPNIGDFFRKNFYNGKQKYISPDFSDKVDEIYSIIDGLIKSGGSVEKSGHISFTSTSQDLVEYLRINGPLAGFNISNNYPTEHKELIHPKWSTCYKVGLAKRNSKLVNDTRIPISKVNITNETLEVYCVSVSTGLILVRGTTGVTFICGNCAVLEQGTVYLRWPITDTKMKDIFLDGAQFLSSRTCCDLSDPTYYNTTTNYRYILQKGLESEMEKYWHEPDPDSPYWHHRVSTLWTISRGITHELVRHRLFSYVMESTRYVNYYKRGFQYIIPRRVYNLRDELARTIDPVTSEPRTYLQNMEGEDLWNELCILDRVIARRNRALQFLEDEYIYETTTDEGIKCKPEDAREILPHQVKADIWMTGFYDDWIYEPPKYSREKAGFFKLRCDNAAHPDIRYLARILRSKFDDLGYVK